MEVNLIAISVQTVGTLLVAALLWQLPRLISGRFLRYWSVGWVALAVALLALRAVVSPAAPPGWKPAGLVLYCAGEYLFGYLLWAGFRDYARGVPISRADLRVLGPLAAFGLTTPFVFPTVSGLYPFHAPIFALFFALALSETFRGPRPTGRPLVALNIARVMLLALTVLFLHYGPLVYWAVYVAGFSDADSPLYLQLAPVYDAFAELGLAFGMLLLATEKVRAELEETNRRLAEATAQLAIAARTDVLTGLLNRRGFEELLADKAGRPFAGSLGVIDLNQLKPLNDTHGHEAGDAALQLVARALRGHFRVTDPIFRMGGDEFLVVMPGGSSADLTARLERIDRALLAQRLPNVTGTVDLGIAWGVADFATGDELPTAVGKADQAMYARKPSRERRVGG